MRHRKLTLKLNRTTAHLRAMLANAASSLIMRERVKTTQGRAKAVCRLTERMITLGKRGDLHARRLAVATIRDREAVAKLFKDLGPRYAQRHGGCTRVVKASFRQGDGAPMAVCELVDTAVPVRVKKTKKQDGAKKRA